jgi:hypothetical protein
MMQINNSFNSIILSIYVEAILIISAVLVHS